ncbi:hypothetical protein PG997_002629 [Apiospora hydei]|uniref:SET domain-containing protein n=1 Tax=Apiospora hydei TaxID=1337664 RepID=A0ABR1WWX6_9PEZI
MTPPSSSNPPAPARAGAPSPPGPSPAAPRRPLRPPGLLPATQQRFRALRDRNATVPFQSPAKAFAENSFALGPDAHGFFPLLSRFNHCCIPNAAVPLINAQDAAADTGPALIATRDIAAGDEIAFSYDPRFESRTARELHASLGFACGCRACHPPGTRFQRASDLRRRLIRGLQFMVSGDNEDEGEGPSERFHVIADPEVRRRVAECRTPLSVLLVCNLLTQCLMEAEGILDDFEIGRLQPGAAAMAKMFRRPENASVARFAMTQRTPGERLRVAFSLYGRVDDGDEEMAYTLRHIQGLS